MNPDKAEALKQELRAMPEPHLVLIDQFFDGNEDEASIGCNLSEHPGMATFREILTSLEARADVEAVYAHISELDPGEGEWPFADTVWVVGSITQAELATLMAPLTPDEVEVSSEALAAQLGIYHKAAVLMVWWD